MISNFNDYLSLDVNVLEDARMVAAAEQLRQRHIEMNRGNG